MQMIDGLPRRCRIDLETPAEAAIRAAIEAVEAVGAHTLLTEAVVLLAEAQEKVADFVELPDADIYRARPDASDPLSNRTVETQKAPLCPKCVVSMQPPANQTSAWISTWSCPKCGHIITSDEIMGWSKIRHEAIHYATEADLEQAAKEEAEAGHSKDVIL